MTTSSQFLLTFLLNAAWQVALIAAVASFGGWLLRNSTARYRHWLYAAALCLAFFVPAFTASQTLLDAGLQPSATPTFASDIIPPLVNGAPSTLSNPATNLPATFQLNQTLAFTLIAIYGAFFLYSTFKLIKAWLTTRAIRRLAVELEPDDRVAAVIHRCEQEIGPRAIKVMRSETLPVPVTVGLFRPVIILPESLSREGSIELLTSAIGHELIHVARRDYLLNLIYELLFVPLSFHPAAALLRRRVKETRELCCDELVAERILNREVYARSLVSLASSAPPLRRLSVTTTVGIADADILEARIMSLLKKPVLNKRSKKLLLLIVSLLLLVPCIAAAAFELRFDVATNTQDPATQEKERKDRTQLEMKMRQGGTSEDLKEKMAADPAFRAELQRRREVEMEMRTVRQAALVRLARINMDQAIQLASSQQPGKVLTCNLDAKGWEEPGKLGKDGIVFYHVIIADEPTGGATHVFVNAIDGSIIKSEKELPRKRSADLQ
jgi:beta-lactamase regulating signal transducer with metallopeptidase domain